LIVVSQYYILLLLALVPEMHTPTPRFYVASCSILLWRHGGVGAIGVGAPKVGTP